MLGGKGLPINSAREFTDLERVIVDRTLSRILKELDASWKTIEENIHFSLFGKESNPFFVQIVPKAEMVLLVNIKAQVGMVEERMNLCLPFHTLESVMERFNPQEWFRNKRSIPFRRGQGKTIEKNREGLHRSDGRTYKYNPDSGGTQHPLSG